MAKLFDSEAFLNCVEKSRLVDNEAFEKLRGYLRQGYGDTLPEDPVEIAKQFKSVSLLTRWQCEKLLQGKYKGFFLGKYKLLGQLGSGWMSTVYLAEHIDLHQMRAIKLLTRSLNNSSYLQRVQQAIKTIASLNHPNIVLVYGMDNEGDKHYLVMEYIVGSDLQSLVRRKGQLDYGQAADYTSQAAKGLQYLHDIGLIHRNVKPANLFVNREGTIKLLDSGLAFFADESQASVILQHNDTVFTTVDYLAPEQAFGSQNVDARVDIYGLGCTMYFLLTGQPPFDGSIASRIIKHQTTKPPDIRKSRPDCPAGLEGICVKMMQKDPRYRYQNCEQVVEALNAYIEYRSELGFIGLPSIELNVSSRSIVMDGSEVKLADGARHLLEDDTDRTSACLNSGVEEVNSDKIVSANVNSWSLERSKIIDLLRFTHVYFPGIDADHQLLNPLSSSRVDLSKVFDCVGIFECSRGRTQSRTFDLGVFLQFHVRDSLASLHGLSLGPEYHQEQISQMLEDFGDRTCLWCFLHAELLSANDLQHLREFTQSRHRVLFCGPNPTIAQKCDTKPEPL